LVSIYIFCYLLSTFLYLIFAAVKGGFSLDGLVAQKDWKEAHLWFSNEPLLSPFSFLRLGFGGGIHRGAVAARPLGWGNYAQKRPFAKAMPHRGCGSCSLAGGFSGQGATICKRQLLRKPCGRHRFLLALRLATARR